ncbi:MULTISPECIES: aspartyl-phosphate phosphatase Spo0E family protein [Pontibacillus]|uniref:Aspartyl-phosphate phosphatase Spo0E family protein n=1 Tax=Pontibacillus chungwhensis TaxID=265426 RepID=A0ABY8V3A1_9BACI|nr:aspartyl-phosphate phosphatase Spo0E family protein [Pontibacillus chungwhensis]MCD5324621.1 aspartyl-phosphate phosphatase Spo0E family protein [Pontibacillus sp. HN14]WIF99085.1 aspartyl-phosphate phosphatase Spo0E family protein [Pontibacillus chungwhensis]
MEATFMNTIECLEHKIEKIREKMYVAFNNSVEYSELVKISQDLDELLNQLDDLNKRNANISSH